MIYTEIEIVYRVLGNVNPASVERAIQLSRTKYCGLEAMPGKSAHITLRCEIDVALYETGARPESAMVL